MNTTTTNDTQQAGVFHRMSPTRRRLTTVAAIIVVMIAASIVLQPLNPSLPDLHIADAVDSAVAWLLQTFGWFFDGVEAVIRAVLVAIERLFLYIPWVVWVPAISLLAYRMVGRVMGVVSLVGLLLIVSFGLWDNAISTLALVATSMVFTLALAVPLGILASRSDRFDGLIRPILDAMQTMPAFVYILPIVFLLSAGKVPAAVATMIYAMPPAIRLTNLGLRQVSSDTKEAALSFGATRWQMLFRVELPLAMPTIMAGINQATMMAFAMVVIASLIGAGGLGNDVLFALSRVRVGDGFEAGLAILVLAIILDRITQALNARNDV